MFPNYRPNVEASKIQRTTKSIFTMPKINLKSPSKLMSGNNSSSSPDKTDKSGSKKTSEPTNVRVRELAAISGLSFHVFIEGLVLGLATSSTNLWQLFSGI
jgi:hypothetical protein